MRAELRLSIMRKLRSARRSAEFNITGTLTRPNEMWPFQIGRDILLLPKRSQWQGSGQDGTPRNTAISADNCQLAMLATLVPRVTQEAGEELFVARERPF